MASRRTDLFLQVKGALRDAQRSETALTDDELAEKFGIHEGERSVITEARRDLGADDTSLTVHTSTTVQPR